jgi:hypothetical protein
MPSLVAAALAVAFGLPFALSSTDFCLDDAWIHMAYARSLVRGDGLSYNPGDFETGSSSPLWVALLALWPWGRDPVLAVKLLGLLLHAANAALAATLALSIARLDEASSRPRTAWAIALVAGVLTAAHPALLQGATSGMEVSLTSTLLLAAALFTFQGRATLAFTAGLLAVLARPESLFFVGALGVVRAIGSRRLQGLAAPLGASAGLALWVGYCLLASGYPFPNTKYVKHVGLGSDGLAYLALQVLPQEPWLAGLGGAALVLAALVRCSPAQRAALGALLCAWLATLLAVALSRPFSLGVLFYFSRYFAIIAAVPAVAVALGVARVPRAAAALLLTPVLLVNVWLAASTHAQQRAQEEDIRQLHGEPARYMARHLPANAVVVVEGAGASRFFAPRSMTIVDMLGLNDRVLAHARGDQERLCALLARKPTHLLIPDQYLGLTVPLQVQPLRSFVDRAYHMAVAPAARRVELFALTGVQPRFARLCSASAR